MAAPTLVGYSEANAGVASGASVTTGTLSWQTNDVIVLFGATEGGTSGETFGTPTTTGSGITFTSATQQHQSTGSDCGGECWAVVATANSSGTFSIAPTHSASTRTKQVAVFVWRGSAGVGNSALLPTSGTNANRTISLTPTGADGAICWMVLDWAAAAVQTITPTPATHSTSSPGPTALPDDALISLKYTYYFANLDDQTGTGAVSYGIGGSGTGPFTIIAVEVKASAGGSDATVTFPQSITIHP